MSRGINKVILIGNLGGDPETRYMPNGNAVTNISIATTDTWKDKNTGQLQERTEWHRVVMYGKVAEVAAEYLRKGSQVYIEGRLQTRKWQDQQGQDHYATEVVVDLRGTMQILGGRPGGEDGRTAHREPAAARAPQRQAHTPPPAAQPAPDYDSFDDDIPFADPYRGIRSLLI